MTVYDANDWQSHLFDIRGSMLREILLRVSMTVAWSAVVAYCYTKYPQIAIPSVIHTIVGSALALLLVFRTNASYDRFWEGRRMWGGITNSSRNLARLVTTVLPNSPAIRNRTIRWTIAFAYAVQNRLREVRGLGPIAAELPEAETKAVMDSAHPPTAAARKITESLVEAKNSGAISDYVFVALDQNVQQLIDYVGSCERIRHTPIPFAYVVHLRRALILFCGSLPFALVKEFGWWSVPCTLFVSYILFGIEEIGVEIENPFGHHVNDLPLERFCESIQTQLTDLNQNSSPIAGS